MSRKFVNKWLENYVDAWKSPGVSKLSKVFTKDVSYVVSPWKEPIRGVRALGAFWEKARAGPDEKFDIRFEIVTIHRNLAVIKVFVNYHEQNKDQWRDLWIIKLTPDGHCEYFEEWPFLKGQDDGQKI